VRGGVGGSVSAGVGGGLWLLLWDTLGLLLWVKDTLASVRKLVCIGDTVERDVLGVTDVLLVPVAEHLLVTLELGRQGLVSWDGTLWLQGLWNWLVLLGLLGWLDLVDASTSRLELVGVKSRDWGAAKGTSLAVVELAEDGWVLEDILDVVLHLDGLRLVAS